MPYPDGHDGDPTRRELPTNVTCAAQPVQLVWRSASPPEIGDGEDGMAWCSDCIQPGMAEHSWACLPVHMIPSSLREQARYSRQEHASCNSDTRQSHFGACPLCGIGEAGAEHIWQWCSAAVMAWAKCGDGYNWREALAGRCNDRLRLTIVTSQVVFLHTSLIGRTSATADDSARRITKVVRALVSLDDRQAGPDDKSGDENPPVDADTWVPFSECVRCNRGEQSLCRTACKRQSSVNYHRTNEATHVGATVTARISANVGRILATLYVL